MKNKLDFIIIGAQKSGTTTLFELFKQHKELYIPPEKEAPFFGVPEREEKGWNWYLKEFFSEGNENLLWGSVTTQYMSLPDVAVKIVEMNPHIKIISILRDPYERAYSQYMMNRRRKLETRTYNEVIKILSDKTALEESRQYPTETNSYIIRGEYARILSEYKKHVNPSNLLILFLKDLENDPQTVLNRVCAFLCIGKFTPEDMGTKFLEGSSEPKSKFIAGLFSFTRKNRLFKSTVRKIVPFRKLRRRFWYKMELWNIQNKNTASAKIPSTETDNLENTNKFLNNIYNEDSKLFQKEFSMVFSWDKYEKIKSNQPHDF